MPRDRRPRGQRPGHRLGAAEDVRQKGQRRAKAVIAGLVDKPARGGEKAPQLPARLVKMTGRRPALRSAHDRRGAMLAPDPGELAADEVERPLPGHRDKGLAAAATAAAGSIPEPAGAYHRPGDARRRMHRIGNAVDQRRGIGIQFERQGADDLAVLDDRGERTPVRMVGNKLLAHRHSRKTERGAYHAIADRRVISGTAAARR